MQRKLTTIIATLVLATPAMAQSPACDDQAHRQFDFWLGTWNVWANEKLAGTNTITKAHGGCVLHEQYETGKGYAGSSFNIYDRSTGKWHQTWVDNGGLLLQLDGSVVDGNMVLEGSTKTSDGKDLMHRITWTPNDDGTVRQLWESRGDDGEWTVSFDGLYRHKDQAPEVVAEPD